MNLVGDALRGLLKALLVAGTALLVGWLLPAGQQASLYLR
jgi:hypothetical protein